MPLNICKLSRLHKHYLSSEDRNFLPLAELLTVHPPQRAAKTYARFSLFLSHFLLHFLSFLGRCDLLKSPYFSFTTEDNYYAPEENELTELEFSLKQSSKRKR